MQLYIIYSTTTTDQDAVDLQDRHSRLGFSEVGLKIAHNGVPLSIHYSRSESMMHVLSTAKPILILRRVVEIAVSCGGFDIEVNDEVIRVVRAPFHHKLTSIVPPRAVRVCQTVTRLGARPRQLNDPGITVIIVYIADCC